MSISSLHPGRAQPWGVALRIPPSLLFAGIILIACLERWIVMPNANIAWLLTVADRVLDGQRLYVDTIETNPPFSIWLHLPAAWLARALGWRAEPIFDAMVFAFCAWALWAFASRMRRAATGCGPRTSHMTIATAACLLILPAACFGEREHIATIAFMPFAAGAWLRALKIRLAPKDIALSAGCIALIVMIKPHFALAIGAVALASAIIRRDWRPLVAPEFLIGGAIATLYAATTLVMYPEFWSAAMPLNTALYLPLRYGPAAFLWHFADLALAFVAILMLALLRGRGQISQISGLVGFGALGFFAAAVLQGKGMPYHFYPPLALAVLVPFLMLSQERAPAHRLLSLGLSCVFWTWFNAGFDLRHVVEPVRAAALRPKVLALGYDFSIGPPVARAAGGTYVGRDASQWIADNAEWLKAHPQSHAETAAMDAYIAQDRSWFIDDLILQRPDVLFIQSGPEDWRRFADTDPRFATAMADFELKGTVESRGMRNATTLSYDMWVRRPQ